MKIVATQSIEADTAYVTFGDEREVAETIAALEDVTIDLDTDGRVVGIEFVTASRVLHPSALRDAEKDELIGVTAIAELLGRRKQNVAQHYTRRPDFPEPVAELPTGRYWRRGDVEEWWERSGVGRAQRAKAEGLATAAEWLTTALRHGGQSVEELRRRSAADDISWSSVERAADAIDVEEHHSDGDVVWALPSDHPFLRRRA
jgi:uncharacterized protein YuzE